jgi:hypothetical protein
VLSVPDTQVYARQLIERIAETSDKPLLLAVALKPEGRDAQSFQHIINKVNLCDTLHTERYVL